MEWVQRGVNKADAIKLIKELNAKERIQEVARMLGGQSITKQALAHAKEMLTSDN